MVAESGSRSAKAMLILCALGTGAAFLHLVSERFARAVEAAERRSGGIAPGTLFAQAATDPASAPAAAPETPPADPPVQAFGPTEGGDGNAGGAPDAAEFVSEDWPRFLGPRRDMISRETGLFLDWTEERLPPMLWARAVGEAYSAPVVADGKVVFFHREDDVETIEAATPLRGETVWKFSYRTDYEDRYGYNNGPRSSPSIDGDAVYAYGAEGVLTRVNFADGKLVWQRRVNDDYAVPQGFFGAGCAPVVEGGLILLNVGGKGASVAAFRTEDGSTAWAAGDDEASYSTPALATIHGRRTAVFLTRDGLLAADVADGTIRWRYPFRSKTHESVNAATPIVQGDLVFLSATYNVGAALLRLKDAPPPDNVEVVWRDPEAMQNHWATSILRDGYLYGMDGRHENGSNFRCVEFATGKVLWTADEGLGRATYLMAEGRLIALGERGELAAIDASPEGYREIVRVKALRYPCWTPPVLSGGLLYLRNENSMMCLDLRSPERREAEARRLRTETGPPAESTKGTSAP